MNTLIDYLAKAVRANPDQVAVCQAERALSYSELARCSDTLAAALCRAGAGPSQRVVIQLPAGVDQVVAVWAVLKTGAAYVPLDPAIPRARMLRLIRRIRPCAAITNPSASLDAVTNIDVQAAYGEPDRPPPTRVRPQDPAYILHTSGSTGVPKGVVLTHRNATAFVDWAVEEFHLGPDDRIAGHAPAHFDLSVLDLFGAAKAGATLLPVPAGIRMFGAELAAFLTRMRVTMLYCVPTALTMLSRAATSEQLALLRLILFAGEVCPHSTLEAMFALAPRAQYVNMFGPTETNVCTYHRVSSVDLHKPLPIGFPIRHVDVRVMATREREARIGELGELYVSGPTVAGGYWEDSEQSAERFIASAVGSGYRTGDMVVRDETGRLHFRGRADRQIKTRGHRVELDEVETVLHTHPAVLDAAVFAVPDEAVTNRLIAAIMTPQHITTRELRQTCAAQLPGYAIPASFRLVKEFPLTSTGKLDRATLSHWLTTPDPVTS